MFDEFVECNFDIPLETLNETRNWTACDVLENRYKICSRINVSSGYSYNYTAIDYETNAEVAIKQCFDERDLDGRKEAEMLERCENEKILKLVDYFVCDHTEYIVTEYCEGGDLLEYINQLILQNKNISFKFVLSIMIQMAEAVYSIEEKNTIHGDIKLENFLVKTPCPIIIDDEENASENNDEIQIVLGDFGFARLGEKDKFYSTNYCTKGFASPELLNHKVCSFASDIFALGKIFELFDSNVCSEETPAEFKELVARMTAYDPSDRPDIDTIKEILNNLDSL